MRILYLLLFVLINFYNGYGQINYSTSFDGCNASSCSDWSISGGFLANITPNGSSGYTPCNTASAKANIYGGEPITTLERTASIGTATLGSFTLNFSYKCIDYFTGTATPAGYATFNLYYKTSSGGPWTQFGTFNNVSSSTCVAAPANSFGININDEVYIRIVVNRNSGDFWAVMDDISLVETSPPSCSEPSALTSSNITATTADISWTPPGSPPSNGYEYYYSTINTPPGGSGTPTAGTSVSLLVLNPNTTYYFWVRSDCGGSGYSTWAGPASFKTPPGCGGTFYDSGGASGNYSDNEDITTTIYPDNPGEVVTVYFTAFNTESSWDGLMIYDGPDATYPLISSGSNYNNPPTCPDGAWTGTGAFSAAGQSFTSTDASGALTFVFKSDGSFNYSGWAANITCAPIVPPTNDDAPGAITLTVGSACVGADYTNVNATYTTGEPTGIETAAYATVWFKFTAPASGAVRISTDHNVGGTLTDTRIALYEATNVNDYSTFTALTGDEDGGSVLDDASIAYATGLTSGATYYIQVDKWHSANSSGTFCITVDELTSAMLATGTCATATNDNLGSNSAYVGWVNILDNNGKLIMQIRKPTGVAPDAFDDSYVNINTGGVRQDAAGKYYLDRNYSSISAPSGPYDIKLYFLGSERTTLAGVDPAAANLANLNVTHDAGVGCKDYPTGGDNTLLTQTSNGSVNGAEWVQVTTPSFSGFFINTGNNPLPVNLLDFTARATREGMVELNWIVAEEKGMKEYVVERSTDGRNFIAIGTVSAAQKTDYALTDNRPVSAVNYYRLKMVDRDGAFKYSEVRQVVFSNGRLLSLYPNPTSGHVYVSGLEGVKDAAYVNIYNEMGMSIYSGKIGGDQLASGGIDMSKYAPGAYMIRVISDEANTTMRFVKE